MDTRREFIKKASLLSGAAGLFAGLPASIQKAFAIDPEPGTTWLDAEHIVVLMQENRSFDHCYGTLQGVRGFDDPRAVTLPNQNQVWLQTNSRGETYAPFRLNIKETNATWMGSLPHSWTDQVDARNNGKHDKWLDVKQSGHTEYAKMPLTMGFYTREDVPFYYALADAFTICDQNFCSSLTGTMPNRLYLWSGTIRGVRDASAPAKVLNENVEYESSANWMTFPERLEDNGVSWKVYQNETYLDVGFTGEEGPWLSNFGDNPLEWFTQYHARFSPAYRKNLDARALALAAEIKDLKGKLNPVLTATPETLAINGKLDKAEAALRATQHERGKWSSENFEKLSTREKNLREKAFSTNEKDRHYHELTTLSYRDNGQERTLKIPKGDVLDQFRRDVENGQLPAISWIVAPENFSDHPSSAWFGAWYLSEVIDILTRNPNVWKKTIFILNYDENDGYFDHIPPFAAPHPKRNETGAVSPGLNVEEDYVTLEEELKIKPPSEARESSIGLGYRVPMVIASPWSRGGYVCSQVFDHTSVLQLMEKFVSHKSGKKIVETNISNWRRTVCGDLTSSFRPFNGEKIALPTPVRKNEFVKSIHQAQFKKLPNSYKALTRKEIGQIKAEPGSSHLIPKQEPGTRPSSPLPYQLYAEGKLNREKKMFEITFAAENQIFGPLSAGSPFTVYAPGKYLSARHADNRSSKWEISRNWVFAVAAGSTLTYEWPLAHFRTNLYHVRVHGPNGFYREFKGSMSDPSIQITSEYQRDNNGLTGQMELVIKNGDPRKACIIQIQHNAYHAQSHSEEILPNGVKHILLNLEESSRWYDFTVRINRSSLAWRYAGRVETGKAGITDPAIGA
jgi:phospholipase C